MKCLEKEPGRRYDSARALAEDLGPLPRRRAHPRRAPSGSSTACCQARAQEQGAGGDRRPSRRWRCWPRRGYALWRARRGARSRRRWPPSSRRAWRTSSGSCASRTWRPCTTSAREKARGARAPAAHRGAHDRGGRPGARARASTRSAAASSCWAIPDGARAHLERAWAAGYRTPEVAYALGLALGALYQPRAGAGRRHRQQASCARRARREIQAKYRDPADRPTCGRAAAATWRCPSTWRACSRSTRSATTTRWPRRAAAARASAPWLYEAQLLEGDVHALISREKHETGDAAGSRRGGRAGDRRLHARPPTTRAATPPRARGCARPASSAWSAALPGRRPGDALRRGARAPASRASRPTRTARRCTRKLANIHRFWANQLSLRGDDPRAALDLSAKHARQAIAIDPRNLRGTGNLGVGYRLRAAWEAAHGIDARASLDQALSWLQKAVGPRARRPGPAQRPRQRVRHARAVRRPSRAATCVPDLQAAIGHYDAALQQVPDFGYAFGNRGLALTELARYELAHGLPVEAHLADAEKTLRRCGRAAARARRRALASGGRVLRARRVSGGGRPGRGRGARAGGRRACARPCASTPRWAPTCG